jgi:hypothetical protein
MYSTSCYKERLNFENTLYRLIFLDLDNVLRRLDKLLRNVKS